MEEPIVDADYLLQKFPGKGGWTYAALPEVAPKGNNPFGWLRVRGEIDNYPLIHYKLMPMGNGQLFLPVKSAIRKKIGKEAGDKVHVRLFLDEIPLDIPEELMECFRQEPENILENFLKLPEGDQKAFLGWIYDAKTEDRKAGRIIEMFDRLAKNERFYQ